MDEQGFCRSGASPRSGWPGQNRQHPLNAPSRRGRRPYGEESIVEFEVEEVRWDGTRRPPQSQMI